MIEQCYPGRLEASRAAAQIITSALTRRLQNQDTVAAVVSGGSTPLQCYRLLCAGQLDWSRIIWLPSDERWLGVDLENSNEHMIRSSLMGGRAAAANFLSFYNAELGPAATCMALEDEFDQLPLPLAITLLGMGEDGHFASLFPDMEDIGHALDVHAERCFTCGITAASPHERISLTLKALTQSDEILLLAFGGKKRKVIAAAQAGTKKFPLTALFQQRHAPVRVLWAP